MLIALYAQHSRREGLSVELPPHEPERQAALAAYEALGCLFALKAADQAVGLAGAPGVEDIR